MMGNCKHLDDLTDLAVDEVKRETLERDFTNLR